MMLFDYISSEKFTLYFQNLCPVDVQDPQFDRYQEDYLSKILYPCHVLRELFVNILTQRDWVGISADLALDLLTLTPSVTVKYMYLINEEPLLIQHVLPQLNKKLSSTICRQQTCLSLCHISFCNDSRWQWVLHTNILFNSLTQNKLLEILKYAATWKGQ